MAGLVVIVSSAHAQASSSRENGDTIMTPFHPQQQGNTWVVKGKILPWALIGLGINYTLGMEYGFRKVNSIGFTLTYDDMSFPHEVYDTISKEYVAGPRMYQVNRGVFLNYRRYPHFPRWSKADITPHFDAFVRYGLLHDAYEDDYTTNIVEHTETHYSAGIAFGIVIPMTGRLCLDAGMGPFWKVKDVEYTVSSSSSLSTARYREGVFGWRVSANLYFWWRRHGRAVASAQP